MFYWSCSDRCVAVFHCEVNLRLPEGWCSTPFQVIIRHLCILLVECLFPFCLFSNWIVSPLLSLESSFITSRYKSFVWCVACKYFPLVCSLSFHSPLTNIQRAKVLNLWNGLHSPFITIFMCLVHGTKLNSFLPSSWYQRFSLIFFQKIYRFMFYFWFYAVFWVNFLYNTWI